MRLLSILVFSRMKRQKNRLLLVLLAVAASSCLIVWTIGGYRALFTEVINEEADYLGSYDLKLGSLSDSSGNMRSRGGGTPAFGGPFVRRPAPGTGNSGGNTAGSGPVPKSMPGNPGEPGKDDTGGRDRKSDVMENNKPRKTRILEAAKTEDNRVDLSKLAGNISPNVRKKIENADVDQDGFLSEKEQNALLPDTSQFQNAGGERGTNGSDGRFGGGRGTDVVIPQTLITEIQRDPSVILCDQTATVRAFVYSPGMPQITPFLTDKEKGTEPGLQQTPTDRETLRESGKTISDVPDGIDPKLHHSGMAAYRAVMGLPMGMGSMITGTTAQYPPYELKEGKWLRQDKNVPEAVLTKQSAKQLNARPGDNLLIITGTAEYQLEIVGQVDDPLTQGLYVSMPFAKKIAGTPPGINSLNLKLRISAEEFREQWEGKVREISPNIQFITEKEIATQKQEETKQEKNLFLYQAISGTMLAVLASVFIIFTTLNISVREQKRQIAFYRTIGLTRWQVSLSILTESLILAIPGWFGGIITGLFILNISTGTMMTLNYRMTVFSFISVVFGAILAALYPMFRSALVKPLDAVNDSTDSPVTFQNPNRRRILLGTCALLGILFLSSDVYFVHTLPMDMKKKALLHSSIGIFMLALGVLFLIPILIRLTELVFVPLFARIFRFTPNLLRTELSGNIRRTTAVTAVLSIGGGLFVSMQIWGYSMLGPFLPGHGMPERFVAFLPIGLKSEYIDELKNLPGVKANEFLPIALEQAAFVPGTVSPRDGIQRQFANVVFFGADVDKGFLGSKPFIGMQFIQGNPQDAFQAMKNRRGVVITDSLSVDFNLNSGDTLKVTDPKNGRRVLEYPIVGVVSFPGWQWLSKTGGVRRHFGRSGGIVFANEKDIRDDYHLDRYSYFWFNTDGSRSYTEMEHDLDLLAQKNLKTEKRTTSNTDRSDTSSGSVENPVSAPLSPEVSATAGGGVQTAYVKMSTRESLYNSIMRRSNNVIWGLSKMPLITLIITSIAVIGVITNSVRSRRWQFGIMRSVGITRGSIIRMILAEAGLIGITASLSSFLFGFLAAQGALKLGQSMFGTVDPPLILPIQGLLTGFLLTLSLCLLAAVYPAVTTGLKQPLELLQEGRGTH